MLTRMTRSRASCLFTYLKRALQVEEQTFEALEDTFPELYNDTSSVLQSAVEIVSKHMESMIASEMEKMSGDSAVNKLARLFFGHVLLEMSTPPNGNEDRHVFDKLDVEFEHFKAMGGFIALDPLVELPLGTRTYDLSSTTAVRSDVLHTTFLSIVESLNADLSLCLPRSLLTEPRDFWTLLRRRTDSLDGMSMAISNTAGENRLHIATASNELDLVEDLLLGDGALVDVPNAAGCTPLHYAAALGYTELCSILVHHGAYLNLADDANNRPIHYAACKGHVGALRYLLSRKGIEANCHNSDGFTPLIASIRYRRRECVKVFLNHPAVNFDHADSFGETALHLAVSADIDITRDLAVRCVRSVNVQNQLGMTALCSAVATGFKVDLDGIVRCLLDVDGIDAAIADRDGLTPLHHAAKNGNLATCKLLAPRIDGGLLARCKDNQFTPRNYALMRDHLEVAAFLREQEEKLDRLTGPGIIPIASTWASGPQTPLPGAFRVFS